MKHLLQKALFFLMVLTTTIGFGQTQLAAWTFDTTATAPGTPNTVAANLGLQSGVASIFANGTNGSSSWITATTGNELTTFAGTTVNDPRTTTNAGNAYSLVGGSATSANSKKIVLKLSTTGYENPVLTFSTRGTSAGFTTHQWAWSTDNITYTNFGTNTSVITGTFLTKTLDMSLINDLDNATTIYLRLTVSGATNGSGNNRLDNFVVNATAIPPTGPIVITNPATSITNNTSVLNASINANGTTTDTFFEYGTTISYGGLVAGTPATISGSVATAISASITSLLPNVLYNFRAVGIAATQVNGANLTFTTLANVPNSLLVNNPQLTSLDVTVDNVTQNSNPAITQYAIKEQSGQFVQANGTLGVSAVWQTAALWGTKTVTGLSSNTTYTFSVKARNLNNVETIFSSNAQGTTLQNLSAVVNINTALNGFSNVCVNSFVKKSFSFDGNNLNGSDLLISSLNGFQFSLTENGTYNDTLVISYSGTSLTAQLVWVKFNPILVQSYNGNILLSGGGLTAAFNISATGSGVNTPVIVLTGLSTSITNNSAVVSSTITNGCSTVTSYGIEYSIVNNFANGSGTQVTGSVLSGGNFSANLTGLNPNVTYYYKAFAIDSSGTVYGSQSSFLTLNIDAPTALSATSVTQNSFIANWTSVSQATNYRLDVSASSTFGTTTNATDLFISEYLEGSSNNKYLEIYNGTGASVNLSDYQLRLYSNGGITPSSQTLSGTLANGSTIVYKTNTSTIYSGAATVSSAVNYNGNDAIALYKISSASNVDIFGRIGDNIPTAWTATGFSTLDKTLVRKSNITAGVTVNPSAGFPTLATEWIQSNIDTVSNLGSHTMNGTVPSFISGYENLLVNGNVQTVSGLNPLTPYYYRVRAANATSTSINSNVISLTTLAASPTFGTVSQSEAVCDGAQATINITGLLSNSTSTISFNINNGLLQSVSGVIADGFGNASFGVNLILSNNNQNLNVVSVERTDENTTILNLNTNNSTVLSVLQNTIYYQDLDNDSFGNSSLSTLSCNGAPIGYVANSSDCDDSNINIFQTGLLFVDADGDQYTVGSSQSICYGATVPTGFSLISLGTDCNDANNQVSPGKPEILYNAIDDNCDGNLDEGFQIVTQLNSLNSCNQTLLTISQLIYANIVSGLNVGYRFRVTDTQTNAVQTIDRNLHWFGLGLLSSYEYARTYKVEVMIRRNGVWLGYYGGPCFVTTPALSTVGVGSGVSATQCGTTLATISTIINTVPVANATGYRFRLTNTVTGLVQTIDRTLQWFSITNFPKFTYGTTYAIEVAVKTTSTTYSPYGATCTITTPDVLGLVAGSCGVTLPSNSTIVYTTPRDRVTTYRFQLINTTTNAVKIIDRTLHWFGFNVFAGYAPGTAYEVRVAYQTTGDFSVFSEVCLVTSPGTARGDQATAVTGIPVATTAFDVMSFPNPFTSNFGLDIKTLNEGNVGIKVYDMIGKLIEVREVQLSDIQNQSIGDKYPSGVYNMIVTQGENIKTLRVIKR